MAEKGIPHNVLEAPLFGFRTRRRSIYFFSNFYHCFHNPELLPTMSRPEDTLCAPQLRSLHSATQLTPPPSPQPPRPLLQRLRVAQIHHLLPHPDHPIRHDPPRPLPPLPPLPLPHPRHRLRLRSLGRNPLFRAGFRRRAPRVGRHGCRSVDAGYRAAKRCGRGSAAGGYRAGGPVSRGEFRRGDQY